MIYEWKPGTRARVDAQQAGEALEALRIRGGGFTPATVLDEARSPVSPLHPAFEWDDSKAAEEYRLDQARYIIRSVVVTTDAIVDLDVPTHTRAFVVVEGDDIDQVYTSIAVALSDDNMRQQIVSRALRELKAWQSRYAELKEFAELFAAAGRVETQLQLTEGAA